MKHSSGGNDHYNAIPLIKVTSLEKKRAARLKASAEPEGEGHRMRHLLDPWARLAPLEDLMRDRFGMTDDAAASLVANARTSIGANKWEPWTDELYIECERLHNSNRSKPSLKAKKKYVAALIEDRDDISCASGWSATTGWSSVWDDSKSVGDFSVDCFDLNGSHSTHTASRCLLPACDREEEDSEIASTLEAPRPNAKDRKSKALKHKLEKRATKSSGPEESRRKRGTSKKPAQQETKRETQKSKLIAKLQKLGKIRVRVRKVTAV